MSLLRTNAGYALDTPKLLFGLQLDPITLGEAVDRCRVAIERRNRMVVGVVNAAKVVNLVGDDVLRDSLLECDMLLADGQSVVWASRIMRQDLPERVTGIDLFESLLDLADAEHRSIYLVGATPEVIQRVAEVVKQRWPHLILAGARDGYFSDDESAGVAADIAAAKPDMLFLGMTSPKKEIFLGRFGDQMDVPVCHGVGGSFDILAGVTRRAPVAWQRVGMEWAYRLAQEPGRMWRRYLRTNTAFLGLVVMNLVRPQAAYTRSRSNNG